MPNFETITKSLQNYAKNPTIKTPVGVFVGGTSGIGLNTAITFARVNAASEFPTKIYLVGRDSSKAIEAENLIKEVNASAVVNFLKHDMCYIEQAKRVANIVKNHESKLNLLFVGQGGFPSGGRSETEEGIDRKVAVCYYTRWQVVDDLVSLLAKAAEDGESARVITVLGAGREAKAETLDITDFEMKNNYSVMRILSDTPAYNTLAAQRFAREYPKVSFIHTSPGFVTTSVFRDTAWYLRPFLKFATWFFAVTPKVSGESHLYAGLTAAEYDHGAHMLNQKMDEVYTEAEKESNKGLFSVELQEALWKDTERVFNLAISRDASQ
ncbi:uncharacterized protein SAPINGB_P001631 [Magnusiomyces paraingens]|uniref:NAD(P)-binding protein n=1 Tax=Magnusiomyces paraingens TaxID=2606893 RepID=A0A5E8B6V8_9ASCO|nr:uncharacterized protein SAPINGB_P001631 [Saprochaete ingens]VVT47277.1 unnamed protein product [Saprochaete ingens]